MNVSLGMITTERVCKSAVNTRRRVLCALAALAACAFFAQTPAVAVDGVTLKINLVFENNRVMIYKGGDTGLKTGETYDVVLDGGIVGRIVVAEIKDLYILADIKEGTAPRAWEGREVTLQAKPVEKAEEKEGKKKDEDEEKKEKKKKKKKDKDEDEDKDKKKKTEEKIAEQEYEGPKGDISAPLPEKKKSGGYTANSMLRYESHDSSDAPDDYINYLFLVSRAYDEDLVGNIFFYNSYNKSEKESSSTSFGLSAVKMYPPDAMASIGYSYVDIKSITAGDNNVHVISLSGTKVFDRDEKEGHNYSGSIFFNKSSGAFDSSMMTLKAGYEHVFNKDLKGRLALLYNYDFDESEHLSNQLSATVLGQWTPRTRYSLEYLFTDFQTEGSADKDDDRTLRFSLYQRH